MPDPGNAVFLSYAREDGEVVAKIADALRGAGVEVWFDQSELRGGDAWDQKIRRQIKECALFVPVVSANTQARLEGYFRREWKWAAERTHDMAHDLAFLVPVTIDGTKENAARVPEEFLKVQWTLLRPVGSAGQALDGEKLAAFAGRVWQLLDGPKDLAGGALTPGDDRSRVRAPGLQPASKSRSIVPVAAALLLLGAGAAFWFTRTPTADPASSGSPANVPAASVAVLAFENRSDDKANEFFAEGISDELLTVLQKIPGLRVTARMSAFSFKGKNATAQEIGRQLGVAYLVNGSVQKSGGSIRLVARLDRADTGEQVWGEVFQRELKDVFAVQSELAATIIGQLRSRLGGGATVTAAVQAQVQTATRGGTKNTAAHEAYLQGRYFADRASGEDMMRAIEHYQRAVELDERYALAWAALGEAQAFSAFYGFSGVLNVTQMGSAVKSARDTIDRALGLEPDLPEGLQARATILLGYDFDWKGVSAAVRRALELAPQNPKFMFSVASALENLGRFETSLQLLQDAVFLDPVNPSLRLGLRDAFARVGKYDQARQEHVRAIELSPDIVWGHAGWAVWLLRQGNTREALIEAEKEQAEWTRLTALAMAHWQARDTVASDAALGRMLVAFPEFAAYQIAEVYAFRDQGDLAFEWLERALRQRDGGIAYLRLDPVWSRLHKDPRWPAFLRKVGLADEQVKEWGW